MVAKSRFTRLGEGGIEPRRSQMVGCRQIPPAVLIGIVLVHGALCLPAFASAFGCFCQPVRRPPGISLVKLLKDQAGSAARPNRVTPTMDH